MIEVWAPRQQRVRLRRPGHGDVELTADGEWFRGDVSLEPGDEYGFVLGDGDAVRPDPRSRRQPYGVHERSAVDDPALFDWTDAAWTGRQLAGAIIYELHIGTFTPEGTLDAAISRFAHLHSIGVTHIELLPVNGFNGTHNWGYDGVLWYTVHEAYGGPEAYRRFVDAAHAAGFAVIQDVVYNHLGPSGNYLPEFGPYLRDGRSNTWGDSLNLDAAPVRDFIVDNAMMWLRDFHVDGLRLDAVHALHDEQPVHILQQLGEAADALSAHQGRPLTLIAESDLNDPVMFLPRTAGGYGLAGQWSDDFHHALHVALTGETVGYYEDFAALDALPKTWTGGFFHDGSWSSFREREHGKPVPTEAASWHLVTYAQTHDQVGNRAAGDRLAGMLTLERQKIAAVLTLTAPGTPMLFMGEEWAASTPWQFFTSHPEPELAEATAKGRIAEFVKMGWDESLVPDPNDPETFERSHLDWSELGDDGHGEVLDVYRRLAALRRERPELTDPRFEARSASASEVTGGRVFELRRGAARVLVNLSTVPWAVPAADGDAVWFATDADPELVAGEWLVLPEAAVIVGPAA